MLNAKQHLLQTYINKLYYTAYPNVWQNMFGIPSSGSQICMTPWKQTIKNLCEYSFLQIAY
jgi:hypothetical protein